MSSSSLISPRTAAQKTPTSHGISSSDSERWVETVTGVQLYHLYRARCDEQNRQEALAVAQTVAEEQPNHIDPRLFHATVKPKGFPRADQAARRSRRSINNMSHGVSPRAQREVERLDEYIRLRESKQQIRRIIKVIQDKRRDEFRVLREALYQVYHYSGPYLQRPGEKEAAARLLRFGSLGKEFIQNFDNQAKWQWLQMRVNAL
ncbi:hypothetical protein DFH28DRAFT_936280 [Melampsora americana]|nr:hypothetical protein DFH28DRAFT_936280 [Melampsora americana]